MKVSLNWIKQFLDFDLPPVEELVEKIGAQLGAVEEVIDLGKKYQGILIVKVVSCEKLEGSDHLSICKVDDGGKAPNVERDETGHVQVVCGAPNVHASMLAAWLPPGTTVPSTINHEPFVLEAREIRGQKSNGMLASPKELALGDNHEGILEIDKDVKPGDDFVTAYKLDDYVIDIENKMFTHRPDCFGALGIAREVAGILGHQFKSPDWYMPEPTSPTVEVDELKLEVKNELPELCPRFTAIVIGDVKVGPSPLWLQVALGKLGQKSINNIVDYTNFYMLVTSQPLHAYNYDKVKARSNNVPTIVVRKPNRGEKIKLLNGKEIEPSSDVIMIATDKELIGIGGVMGGADTEVDENTTNIILECATFDMYSIRRTSMALGLFTDAVTRFSKGQSPLQNLAVLAKIVNDLTRLASGKVAGQVIDDKHLTDKSSEVKVSTKFINDRLGEELSAAEMQKLLENVELKVEVSSDELKITAPFWRTDIEIPEDVVEEVGRLYGYDKLPLELPKRSIAPAKKNELLELKNKVREVLSRAGADEVLTYSFVHGDLLEKAGQDPAQAFQLANALSPDLQYYRLSLTPSLLDKVHPNVKAGYARFALFEIGKGHNLLHKDDDDGLPSEFEMLDLVYAATDKSGLRGAAYFEAQKFLTELLKAFNVEPEFRPFEKEEDYPVVKPYDFVRSAQAFAKGTGLPLGMVGEYKPSVRQKFKLPKYAAGFGIGLTQLLQATQQAVNGYVALPRFPKVTQDITLKVAAELPYAKLFDFVSEQLESQKPKETYAMLEPIDIFQRDDDKEHKQVALRLNIASYEKTMTDAEVNKLLDEVAAAAQKELGAERI